MQLLTKELLKRFKTLGEQEDADPIVVCKFFNPTGAGRWYATEYDESDRTFYGFVSIFGDHCDEWGRFSFEELEQFRGEYGLPIERDLYFNEGRAKDVIPELSR